MGKKETYVFKKVAVLKGGPSAEREVSLRSGTAVAQGLREAGYEVIEIDVQGRSLDLPRDIDGVFIALHGEFGEDGEVQAILEKKGIPYTGSGVESSRRSFDKILSKEAFSDRKVLTPQYETLRRGDRRTLSLPVVVKPVRQGSSVGVHRIRQESDWQDAVEDTFKYGEECLVESFIPGRELTVGIVGRTVLPVVEIVAPDGWYDYKAKYTKGATRYIVPSELDEGLAAQCRQSALDVFDALDCRGMARIDFRLNAEGQAFALELNAIPGFTETSLLPKAAASAGMSFSVLCDNIMKMAQLDSDR